MKSSITFVSALFDKQPNENIIDLLLYYSSLAITEIQLCIYVSNEYAEQISSLNSFENVKIMKVMNLQDSWIYKLCQSYENPIQLPSNRNHEKDTFEYILSGHAKHECIEDAILQNPWNSEHFAWIDFNIFHLFKNKKETSEYLRWLSKLTFTESFITFPGCWSKLEKEKVNDVLDSVHWRFCGLFFMGDIKSMKSFCELYKLKIQDFLNEHNKITWDFNFWAWMETVCENNWSPIWYRGDHNDSILLTSADIYTRKLENITTQKIYDYPTIPTYYPTSACYLYYKEKHWLNTRYVNYWIYPNGAYLFHNGNRLIENKNILSEIDYNSLEPIFYKEINECINLPFKEGSLSKGLEDIRLYEVNGVVKYIATTIGYSPVGKSRMIIGKYDIENAEINEGEIIEPPNADSWCEKNWIPIIRKNKIILPDGNLISNDEEIFIYKWFPLEIGKIVNNIHENNEIVKKLEIINSHSVPTTIFSKIRGSTIFHETEKGLIGVVHYSEEHSPRHYYHMLVLLDKETLEILNYTETFYFEKLGIEFCIGFMSKQIEGIDSYIFWISRHDRDPITLSVKVDEIKWMK